MTKTKMFESTSGKLPIKVDNVVIKKNKKTS